MSRSRKKNAIMSITCIGGRAGAQKSWKRSNHRSARKRAKQALVDVANGESPEEFRTQRALENEKPGDPWCSPADGKQRIEEDSDWFDKAKRK